MDNFILGSISTLIALLIGYFLGKGTNPIPKETIQNIKEVFERITPKKEIGAVMRPTAQQVEDFNNPVKQAGDKEMSELLGRVVKE